MRRVYQTVSEYILIRSDGSSSLWLFPKTEFCLPTLDGIATRYQYIGPHIPLDYIPDTHEQPSRTFHMIVYTSGLILYMYFDWTKRFHLLSTAVSTFMTRRTFDVHTVYSYEHYHSL